MSLRNKTLKFEFNLSTPEYRKFKDLCEKLGMKRSQLAKNIILSTLATIKTDYFVGFQLLPIHETENEPEEDDRHSNPSKPDGYVH